jgi:hypothetical protein
VPAATWVSSSFCSAVSMFYSCARICSKVDVEGMTQATPPQPKTQPKLSHKLTRNSARASLKISR